MPSTEFDIAILNGQLITMNEHREIINNGFLLIKDDKIASLGTMKEWQNSVKNKSDCKTVIDAEGQLVLPGFINAHGHLPMSLLRGVADDLPLEKWLQDYIWPIEAELQEGDCYIGSKLAALEMIKGGTTCACDMYFYEEETLQALEEIGFRGILGYGMIDLGDEEKGEKELKETEKFIKTCLNKGTLCQPIVSPHAVNTCSDDLLLASKRLAEKYDLNVQIHLAETQKEVAEIKKFKGNLPVKHLTKIDFFGPRVVAAHGVYLEEPECQLLKELDVSIAHNPKSNLKLGSGIINYPRLRKYQINVALGTDGAASNNNLSMIEELRTASLLQKGVRQQPMMLPAEKAIALATINGAKAFGLEKRLGSLIPGKQADIILISYRTPHTLPKHNPYATITYATRDENVQSVIINGKIVMKDRKVLPIDEMKLFQEAQKKRKELLERAGFNEKVN
jgi:5-methylthioadenosine/S-adenosylhomocysteine deaminase